MNRETTKMLALSSGETDKFEKITDEEALPFDQSQITYCPLGKTFVQQTNITEDKGKKSRL